MPLKSWRSKSTKYQRLLNYGNLVLFVVSTFQIFAAIILIVFYHLPTVSWCRNHLKINKKVQLSFWTSHFATTPLSMLGLGLYTMAVSIYLKIIRNRQSRWPNIWIQNIVTIILLMRVLILLIGIFLSLSFFVQVWSTFSALELRKQISTERAPVIWMQQVTWE